MKNKTLVVLFAGENNCVMVKEATNNELVSTVFLEGGNTNAADMKTGFKKALNSNKKASHMIVEFGQPNPFSKKDSKSRGGLTYIKQSNAYRKAIEETGKFKALKYDFQLDKHTVQETETGKIYYFENWEIAYELLVNDQETILNGVYYYDGQNEPSKVAYSIEHLKQSLQRGIEIIKSLPDANELIEIALRDRNAVEQLKQLELFTHLEQLQAKNIEMGFDKNRNLQELI